MKKYFFLSAIALLSIISSCSDDDGEDLIDFTVSFSSATVSLGETDAETEITLSFSRAATETGTITVSYTGENAAYGTDFTTLPAGGNGTISVPVAVGDLSSTITFTKLQNPIEGTTKSVALSLNGYDVQDWANGATISSTVSFTPIAATGGIMDAEQGGLSQPNQVYIDLSSNTQTAVRRDSWEIAFYSGTENRVFLNSSLLVSAAELNGVTDILSITEDSDLTAPLEFNTLDQFQQSTTVTVTTIAELIAGLPVSYPQYGNVAEDLVFTDNKEGTLEGTAFAEISTTPEQNNVYIVSLGNEIPTEPEGSLDTTGNHRGFLKVRVLTDGNSYTVQYAALNETSNFSEVTVQKDDSYNLLAFSLTDGQVVNVEPEKDAWDLNLSGVFSFYGAASFGGGAPTIAGLTFSDYVLHNTLGGVGLYQVTLYSIDRNTGVRTDFEVPSYANFSRADVVESELVYDDRAIIASEWRSVFGVSVVKDDRYFVLKDADDNYYKLLFTAFTNDQGERGFPQFTYERL